MNKIVLQFACLIALGQALAGPLSPAESLGRFTVFDDLEIDQVLAEPLVEQPLFVNFDERGRLWLVQYRQYPNPAGLKMTSRDNYWRVIYDSVPAAPPNHVRGRDKITIHEDTDGDGKYDRHKTFLDGLNIVTSLAHGRGGVWVLNPPYLLFYPDKNRDDIPDGDPEVHLAGFGLEDTHSVVNSLRWGPDGWLYAAQGSTVTAKVIRPGFDEKEIFSMGQNIWRYHPESRRYEVFAEGGGNAFGVEIDAQGRIYSGHNGGDTRGFHYVQGGYLRKGFSKHGPLSNPYAFGYFNAMPHNKVPRFTHNFIVYEGDGLPKQYLGRILGVEPIQGRVVMSDRTAIGSSFKTQDTGHPIKSSDSWFRPVDIKAGPDGAVYVCDWYDSQVNHYRNHEGRIDPQNGRVYRLRAKGAANLKSFNFANRTSLELVELLQHKDKWHRQTALRLLGDRKDVSVLPELKELLVESIGQAALEAFWAVNLSGGFNPDFATETLKHADPHVRAWTVRLLGDEGVVTEPLAKRLAHLAKREPHVEVRSQLAATAKRLPSNQALLIIRSLMEHDADSGDIYQPLMVWWALESKLNRNAGNVLDFFEDESLWQKSLVRQHLLSRLIRRFAKAGTGADLLKSARLFELAPDADSSKILMGGFEQANKGRSIAALPERLMAAMARHGGGSVALGLRRGELKALEEALRVIANPKADKLMRLQYTEILGQVPSAMAIPVLLGIVKSEPGDDLRRAALGALKPYNDGRIPEALLAVYGALPDELRKAAGTLLAGRSDWAIDLLRAVDAGDLAAGLVSAEVVSLLRSHGDERLGQLLSRHFAGSETDAVRLEQEIQRLAKVVTAEPGSPYEGKKLYAASCGSCHRLFEQGGQIGPDLTAYQRDDLDTMLLSIINPGAEIREGYENFLLTTNDGRLATGFLVEQDNRSVVLRGFDGQDATFDRGEIRELKAQGVSLMPGGLLNGYNDGQIRDLMAYLRSSQPLNN
ncbi:MAG: c-type cytochrome [Verrucomicrobiota bacterium]|jgi:putative heme-binding domain-containing protein|nr:c-type cytochrome [Verrucomicrobiota bacterium]